VNSNIFSGYLFASTASELRPRDVFMSPRIAYVGSIDGTQWVRFVYRTAAALLGELADAHGATLGVNAPFEYSVFVRIGTHGHVLFLAQKRIIIDTMIAQERAERLRLPIGERAVPLHRVRVAVHRLVTSLSTSVSPFALTRVDANVPVGDAMKFLVLYGDDIGQSGTFAKIAPSLRFHACGVKRKTAAVEQFHIDSQGRVRCPRPDRDTAGAVDKILSYLYAHDYLRTDKELWTSK